MSKSSQREALSAKQRRQRAVLTGAAVGLYFGLFFRPVREPSLITVIWLSALVTFALLIWRVVRGERSVHKLLRLTWTTFLRFSLGLAVLEARHFAFDWGGRLAVVFLTTGLGALFGWWWEWEKGSPTRQAR